MLEEESKDKCPIKRSVGVAFIPGKPPAGALVVDKNTMGINIVHAYDQVHEWVTTVVQYPDYTYPDYVVYCKWCLEVRKLELPQG